MASRVCVGRLKAFIAWRGPTYILVEHSRTSWSTIDSEPRTRGPGGGASRGSTKPGVDPVEALPPGPHKVSFLLLYNNISFLSKEIVLACFFSQSNTLTESVFSGQVARDALSECVESLERLATHLVLGDSFGMFWTVLGIDPCYCF